MPDEVVLSLLNSAIRIPKSAIDRLGGSSASIHALHSEIPNQSIVLIRAIRGCILPHSQLSIINFQLIPRRFDYLAVWSKIRSKSGETL